MTSWVSGLWLQLGRSAPCKTADEIRRAIFSNAPTRVVCVTDLELENTKNKLKKTVINGDRKPSLFGSFVGEMQNFMKEKGNVSFIKPSELKTASKEYKKLLEPDQEKRKMALDKLKVMQEMSKKRAEAERQSKIEEIRAKEEKMKKFMEEAEKRLRKELEEKDEMFMREFEVLC